VACVVMSERVSLHVWTFKNYDVLIWRTYFCSAMLIFRKNCVVSPDSCWTQETNVRTYIYL
jgi:hypothetical protein